MSPESPLRAGAVPPAAALVTSAWAPLAYALAAVLVAAAISLSDGYLHPLSLAAVSLAAVLALLAVLLPVRSAPGARPAEGWTASLLGAGVAASLVADALFLPGLTVDPARLGAFRPALAAVAALVATYLWAEPPALLRRLRFWLIVAAWLVLAGSVLHAAPWPGIDVWLYQQGGALMLLDGRSPYSFVFRNPYGPGTPLIAPELLTPDGRGITALPYPPLTLLLDLPAALMGDVRWTFVAATAAAALLVRALGRGGRVAELAACLFLLQPKTMMVMELSWTEPVVLAATCGFALLALRAEGGAGRTAGWIALGLVGGLALAAKQYVPLLLIPFWRAVARDRRWRAAAVAVTACAAVYLPFLAWDARGVWRGVVTFQLLQPFRPDALAWPAAIVAWGGPQIPTWPAFAMAGLAAMAAGRRATSAGQALAGGAAAWLLFVLGNKQAFANYYWLAAGLLCAAATAALAPRAPAAGRGHPSGPRPLSMP